MSRTFAAVVASFVLASSPFATRAKAANPPAAPEAIATKRPAIRDVAVQTQDGRSLHFYSDLVKGRVVAVNFIFTSCTTVCPLMGARFARLQQLIGDRRDMSLISVSIDPATDTPARLAAWAHQVGAQPGWTLVTGAKSDIDTLLQSLGSPVSNPKEHSPIVLVIDDRHGTWQRLDGLSGPRQIVQVLEGVAR